ncbi:MAG: hypothetical protein H0U60_13520 [Blastocatellia bacterium]|nr:hypothetical protein [Blastocatellia bacterium]
MARTRMLFITALLLLAMFGAWLWWLRPRAVDMSAYAPADSLVYLESNNPADVLAALANTDAWKLVNDLSGNQRRMDSNNWSRTVVRWTGIGPVNSVIITRAQLAVVVTDLGVAQDDETFTVKPEGALLVETHTSASRIKPSVEQALKKFAETAYGQPTLKQTTVDGFEFIEWIAPGGSRQVVATITGTLVIVGNTERAVQKTLAVALHRLPSLKDDQDLKQLRLDLHADQALAFGYVPAKSSGRLLSLTVPMVLGRAPRNTEFERLIDSASAKIVGSLGWSSTSYMSGIEDRYRIDLQPAVVAKLKESFSYQPADLSSNPTLPENFSSVSYYRFQNPSTAWQGLKTSVASQIDALSAILFSSLLKSALLSYGIDEPDKFLSEVAGPVLTARLGPETGGSMLVAKMRDQTAMRDLLMKAMGFELIDWKPNAQAFRNSKSEFEAHFVNGFIAIGSPPDVARYLEKTASTPPGSPGTALPILSTPLSEGTCVLTYTNDTERVRAFVSTVVAVGGGKALWSDRSERALRSLPYSTTETNLGERGIDRVTRSSLGQFSALLPLVFTEPRKTNENSGG